jgi:hypothetical protein
MALLSVGPLALPLIWGHPEAKSTTKILLTLVVLVATLAVWRVVDQSFHSVMAQYQEVQQLLTSPR